MVHFPLFEIAALPKAPLTQVKEVIARNGARKKLPEVKARRNLLWRESSEGPRDSPEGFPR
jgi:hypothetical protein